MKQWFPFTDYDFYAYLTAGVLLIAATDYSIFGSTLIQKTDWPVVHIIFWIAMAYVVGQITASPSAIILEQWLARDLLRSPASMLLGLQNERTREHIIRSLLVGRIYGPLPEPIRKNILAYSKTKLGLAEEEEIEPEAVFQLAYPTARSVPDAAARMDQFRNLYGFCRNVSFVAFVAAVLLCVHGYLFSSKEGYSLTAASLIVAVGMFGRFIKFYTEFSAEVMRTFNLTILKSGAAA